MSTHAARTTTAPRTDAGYPIADSLRMFWRRAAAVERAGYVVGALLLLSGLIHLGMLVFSGRSWMGPLSLRKPAVFGLSFGVTLITIVWVASFLQLGARLRSALLSAFAVASTVETILVSLQAWRGVPSHFNLETTFDALVARSLAAGGFALVVIIMVFMVVAFRKSAAVPVSLQVAIRVGFVVLCAAMAVGAVMIAKGMMLVFAGHPERAYETGGALKPTHFITMHAILVLPALAWLLSFVDWTEAQRLRLVLVAAVGYVVLTIVVAAGNVAGLELRQLPISVALIGAFGGLAILATIVVTVIGLAGLPASRGFGRMER
jgi:hypothetical protein